MKLSAEHVTVEFGDARRRPFRALDDVSFAVRSGELVAVAGPNGSGKTTLLRTLLGLERRATGRVALDDREVRRYTRRELAERIGALPQREEPAFPLTVGEAVLLGRWAHLGATASVTDADARAMAEALRRCDVAGFEDRRVETLSGGEWQRVRIARALAGTPRLLLLDEPTAALDIAHEMSLFALLRQLVADGLGVLVITHHLNLAARFADRMVLLSAGKAVAEGTPEAVLQADVVSQVFEWPVAVHHAVDGAPQVIPLQRNGAC
jgi:iron complex transport system ATP-binding protein